MRQIRFGSFETNSSSTHSVVIAMESDFNKWKNGELYIDWNGKFISKEDAYANYKSKVNDNKFFSFEDWVNSYESELWDYDNWKEDLEHNYEEFTTPGGETICIECAYGYE